MTYKDSIRLRKGEFSIEDIKRDLFPHLYGIFHELVKFYYFRTYDKPISEWEKSLEDIKSNSTCVKKCFDTHERPSKEQLFSMIWNEWLENEIDKLHEDLVDNLNTSVNKANIQMIDYVGVRNFTYDYFRYFSEILSEYGRINETQILNFLEEYFHATQYECRLYGLNSKESQLPYDVEGLKNNKSKPINWIYLGKFTNSLMMDSLLTDIFVETNKRFGDYDFVKLERLSFTNYYDIYNGKNKRCFVGK